MVASLFSDWVMTTSLASGSLAFSSSWFFRIHGYRCHCLENRCQISAEGVGFEPTRPYKGPNGFQDRRIRPLCHPSCLMRKLIARLRHKLPASLMHKLLATGYTILANFRRGIRPQKLHISMMGVDIQKTLGNVCLSNMPQKINHKTILTQNLLHGP